MISLLSIAKTSALFLLLSGFLIFIHTAEVQAGKSKNTTAAQVLPVGGNTVGGPGFFDSDPANFKVYGGPFASLCLTVTNVGRNAVKMLGIQGFGDLVLPDETTTRCNENTESFRLLCETGAGTCKAFWRLDSL